MSCLNWEAPDDMEHACRAAAAMRAISMTPRDASVGTPRMALTGGLSSAAVAALTPRFFAAKEVQVWHHHFLHLCNITCATFWHPSCG